MKILDTIKSSITIPVNYLSVFIKWLLVSITMGVVGGTVGFVFARLIEIVTSLRSEHKWFIFLLPIGGLIICGLYSILKVNQVGTNDIFESVRTDKKVSVLLLPAIFLSSVITHLCGGSAGREGAALQIGGSMATLIGKIFKFDERKRHILLMCGMSAVFSAVFCTPITATIFAVEVVSVGYFYSSALFPCIISSSTAYFISATLGTKEENLFVSNIPSLSVKTIILVFSIGIFGAIISILFCKTMYYTEHTFNKYLKNKYIRVAVGGLIIVLLTIMLNTTKYNGGGMNIVENIIHNGEINYEAFLLKIIFTAITISAGYKGGEIVPTIFIGASLGGTISSILGTSVPFGAALGVAALFCGVTNCPVASLFLCLELFGYEGIIYYTICAFISFLLSGFSGLYSGQKLMFSKFFDEKIEINAK